VPEEEACASKAKDIVAGSKDPAGERIIKVYSYNPPFYAIYRTRDRLIVHFADPDQEPLRSQQRARIVPLMPMRGQINGLINGWRSANDDGSTEGGLDGEDESPAKAASESRLARFTGFFTRFSDRRKAIARREQFRKVCRYDRRVADAIITLLEDGNNLRLAQELLAQVKNDLIAERTATARGQYVNRAFLLVVGLVGLTGLLAAGFFDPVHHFPFVLGPVWTAVSGGAIGAFFSIATGLKNRDVVIDLQNRENRIDVTLRMVIGAISGAILYSLLATGLVTTKLFEKDVIVHGPTTIGADYDDLAVFLVGFVAGFLERLVPNLLSKTNFGTAEPAGKDTPVQVVPAASDGGQEGNGGTTTATAKGGSDAGLSTDAVSVAQEAEQGAVVEQVGEAPEAVVADDPDVAAEDTAAVPDNPDTEEEPRPQGA
jgi:hypothetical protein